MERRVLRWSVPIDNDWHEVGPGEVILTAMRESTIFEVWTLEWLPDGWPNQPIRTMRKAKVFGTGHRLDVEAAVPMGSALSPDGGSFVWHLFGRLL